MNYINIEQKSDKKAKEFRESGNECFGKKKYKDALILYNKSIAYSCSKREISLSYANRSAVYLEIERYDECLDNITLARENGYPKDKISKLTDREIKCKEKKAKSSKSEDFWEYFKLSYPANKKVPWIADCVEVWWTQKYGRGIYATKELKAGDIICIEESLIDYIHEKNRYNHCYNCFKTNMMNLIPCARSASMMFCSTECMNDCYSKTVDMQLALQDDIKLLSVAAAPFGGFKKFDEFMKETNLNTLEKTIFNFDFSDPKNPEYKKNLMTCFLSLSSLHKYDSGSAPKIFDYVSKKAANHLLEISFANLMLKKLYYEQSLQIEGFSYSLFLALINHSCINNISYLYADNKTIIFVIRPIKAGEQLFHSYFNNNLSNPIYAIEKAKMMQRHKFKCDCEKCTKNSHKYIFPNIPLPMTFMSRKNTDKAKELLQQGWYNINNNISNSQEELYKVTLLNKIIFSTLAYYCTFPC